MPKKQDLDSNSINVLKYYKGEVHHHEEDLEEWQEESSEDTGGNDGEKDVKGSKKKESDKKILKEVVGGGFDDEAKKKNKGVILIVFLLVILGGGMAAFLLFYLGVYLYIESIGFTWVADIKDGLEGFRDFRGLDSFLRYFPEFGGVIGAYLVASLLYFYLALKSNTQSSRIPNIGLGILILIPIGLVAVSYFLLSNLYSFINAFGESVLDIDTPIFKEGLTLSVDNIIVLVISVVVIALIFFVREEFSEDGTSLGKWSKIFYSLVSIILILPTILVLGAGYYFAYFPDDGYEAVEAETSFHVYKPTTLPEDFIQRFNYVFQENRVSSSYEKTDYKTENLFRDHQDLLIHQRNAEENFILFTWVDGMHGGGDENSQIPMIKANEQGAYYNVHIGDGLDDQTVRSVHFVTTDGVHIDIYSFDPETDQEMLRSVAEGLQ